MKIKPDIYDLHQSLRHSGSKSLYPKIAKFFNCFGAVPHHNKPSVSALFTAIANGELDIVNTKTGKGFWNEKGYK